MTNGRKARFLATRLAYAAVIVGTASAAVAAHPVDTQVAAIQERTGTPLIDVVIVSGERACFAKRYGVVSLAEPARLHAASISKLLTATAIMHSVEKGPLSLTDTVGQHLREFVGSRMTIEQLLTHTSGLRDRDTASGRTTQQQTDAYFVALAGQRPADPGWHYADANFNLLGRVIERLRGKAFADSMRDDWLTPLGMSNSDFDIGRIPVDARVVTFRGSRALPHPWDSAFMASSGLQTTAADLGKFVQAVLSVREGHATFIAPQSLTAMTTPRIPTQWGGVSQGYGWQLSDTEIGRQWRHAGGERGFESLLTVYPDRGFGIVVMGNQSDWPRFELERALRSLVAAGTLKCDRR